MDDMDGVGHDMDQMDDYGGDSDEMVRYRIHNYFNIFWAD